MITERTLKKWRKEALTILPSIMLNTDGTIDIEVADHLVNELNNRILQMSQELLDQHLMRRN